MSNLEGGNGRSNEGDVDKYVIQNGKTIDPKEINISFAVMSSTRSAPLPTPDELKQYYDISRDLGDSIKDAMCNEQAHRHECNKKKLEIKEMDLRETRAIESKIQLYAFLLALAGVLGATAVMIFATDWWRIPLAGGFLGLYGIPQIVKLFLLAKRDNPKTDNTEENLDQVPGNHTFDQGSDKQDNPLS